MNPKSRLAVCAAGSIHRSELRALELYTDSDLGRFLRMIGVSRVLNLDSHLHSVIVASLYLPIVHLRNLCG